MHHDELASTNSEALARARERDPGRLWIAASSQTAGRGRNGRRWESPLGNLHASLLLIDPAPPRKAAELGFAAGVAAAHALRDFLSGDTRIAIKWPNDILHDGAKLCGILLESATLPDGRFACVAGFGVNCRAHPENTPYPATDLGAITGEPAAPEEIFALLSAQMAHWLDIWARGAGFASIRAEWLSLAAGLGAWVSVKLPARTVEGIFETIDTSGRLILGRQLGKEAIEAGDVFFSRPSRVTAAAANCALGHS
ncbi:MAG: biotin--[acetyl-CoA-carboxylase] ligase [Beijerinckiaceae bacterium]|nr:biotin--[acetyl-CoA-carboxylase] ligase [Beijerinckiaceae bacterium]